MLSNKLTFSLASLIVLLAFAFVATSAMAAPGGPTVVISDAGTAAAPSTQAAYKAQFTFSEPVSVAATGVTYQFINMNGARVGNAVTIDLTAGTVTTTDNRTYVATIDLTTGGAIPFTHTGFYIDVAENAVTGAVGGQAHTQKLDIPPLLADRTVKLSVAMASTQTSTTGTDYVLTLTFDGTTAPATTPTTAAHLTVSPAALKDSVAVPGTDPTADATNANVYTLPVVLPTGVSEVMIGLEQGYIKNTAIRVPPKEAVKPTVAITATNHNATDKTFRLTVSFTGADPAVTSFDPLTALTVTDSGMAGVTLSHITPMTERQPTATSQAYVAILQYDGLAVPPLTITTSTAYTKTIANMTAPTATVGMAGDGGQQPGDGGGTTLAQPTGVTIARNTAGTGYDVSWTAPTVTTGIGGYYVMYNPTIHVMVGTTMVTIVTADGLPPTSVVVWSTADTALASPAPTTAPTGAVMIPSATLTALPNLMTATSYDGTASASANAVTFTLTALDVAAGNHIVIANDPMMAELENDTSYTLIDVTSGMMDLYDFFAFGGGTIELVGAGTAKGLIISEVMWGENETGNTAAERAGSQWIELYSTNAAATAGAWSLVFTRNRRASANANRIDWLTTYPAFGTSAAWDATDGDHGQGGHEPIRDQQSNLVATPAKTYISMARQIDFVKLDAKTDGVDGVSGGDATGHWLASKKRGSFQAPRSNRLGTPGERSTDLTAKITAKTEVKRDGLVFNEIANRTNDKYDWIELWNQGTDEININGYILTKVTRAANGTLSEEILVEFEGRNDEVIIPAGKDSAGDPTPDNEGYLVIVNTDPAKTDLAVGVDVAAVRSEPRGVKTLYYVDGDLDIPNSGNFLLVLRNHEGKGKIEDADVSNDHEKIVDLVSGNGINLTSTVGKYDTAAWPLHAHPALAGGDITANDAKSWLRNHDKALTNGDAWKPDGGYTGLGYDRNPSMPSGSPGYANGNNTNKLYADDGTRKFVGDITISEIMYQSPSGNRALPQWIELYNSSDTHAVNLDNWRLTIENTDREGLGGTLRGTFRLGALTVPPNQTVLLVSSGSSRISQLDRNTDFFPEDRVYDLFLNHADELDMTDRKDTILSQKGFSILLENTRTEERASKGGLYSDEFSNLDAKGDVAWALPELENDRADRSSLVRVYIGDGVPDDGTAEEGWKYAANLDRLNSDGTYYGDPDDIGSPGWRDGGPLPVSLSSFRPMRDKATGAVVIRWITESELNNAGFNILRSESKYSDFKVVNVKGIIPGHGTTSEKHVYEWTDTSAKPNVVYYYQIEDVSLDGDRTTLRTTHLRGNVNAAGKLTTRWGELKSYGK